MVKARMDIRIKAVNLSLNGQTDREVSSSFDVSERTLRRWKKRYREGGYEGLQSKPPVPRNPHRIQKSLEERIIRLKQRHPHWGARRIKFQYSLPVHWNTVHKVFKRHGLLVRVKARPQPSRRFQRKHVDSMWQCDTFQFRIKGVGKVYVTGFTDDCSRYRIRSKVYLRKGKEEAVNTLRWALRRGRVPREIYVDNGKQFVAKAFKEQAMRYGIKLIFGKPYNPRGRGKIESYHKTLHRDLISLVMFRDLSHFRRELRRFDRRYNDWRKQEILSWQTPASVYHDEKYFNKNRKLLKKRTKVRVTKADKG